MFSIHRLAARSAAVLTAAALVAFPAVLTEPAAAAPTADETAVYVRAVYRDLFGRSPDPAGEAEWTRLLLSGVPREAVANGITNSVEFRTGLIDGAYEHYLGRPSDPHGKETWLGAMGAGRTISEIEAGFIASAEYYGDAGGTDLAWVIRLYQDVLERTPDDKERASWVRELRNGATRVQVSMGFLLSTEHLRTVVDSYYQTLLQRGIDPSGQATWVTALQRGGRDEAIIGGIVASAEYWLLVHEAVVGIEVVLPEDGWSADAPFPVRVVGVTARGRGVEDLTARAAVAVVGVPGVCGAGECLVRTAGTYTVTASADGRTASSPVVVVPGEPVTFTLIPSSTVVGDRGAVTVEVDTQRKDAWGNKTDQFGGAGPQATWDVDGDTTACSGFFGSTVCALTGVGSHTISLRGALTASVRVDAVPDPAPARSTLWVFGDYYSGYEPYGREPRQIGRDNRWEQVSAERDGYTWAVRTDGGLYRLYPLPIRVGSHSDWRSVLATGASTALGLKDDGSLWSVPDHVEVAPGTRWAQVELAAGHTAYGIQTDGSLWLISWWGDGTPTEVHRIISASDRTWRQVSAGSHLYAVADDGTLWTGPQYTRDAILTQVGTASDWTTVSNSDNHTLGIRRDGSMWAWGWGYLGDGAYSEEPTGAVQIGAGRRWSQVAAYGNTSAAIAEDGGLWTWGQLPGWVLPAIGAPSVAPPAVPVQVGIGRTWTALSIGHDQGFALSTP